MKSYGFLKFHNTINNLAEVLPKKALEMHQNVETV